MDIVKEQNLNWFIAIVHTNTERSTSGVLDKMGIQNYVPLQTRVRQSKNGRKVKTQKAVIPGIVFVKCSEADRLNRVVQVHTILRFMMDGSSEKRKVATVPENQIETLKYMVGQSEIPVVFDSTRIRVGKKVRIARGPLKGIEGLVTEVKPDLTVITVAIDYIGGARLSINTDDIEPAE